MPNDIAPENLPKVMTLANIRYTDVPNYQSYGQIRRNQRYNDYVAKRGKKSAKLKQVDAS